jgi:S-ribosylhomocysteine lyase LuxS involved in autoinducer biosynthesis
MYPCIVYSRNNLDTKIADDQPYGHKTGYQVTVIDPNPDSEILGKVAALPLCSFNRHYTKDNLNHDVYNLYY